MLIKCLQIFVCTLTYCTMISLISVAKLEKTWQQSLFLVEDLFTVQFLKFVKCLWVSCNIKKQSICMTCLLISILSQVAYAVLEMKIWIWSESNSWIYFCIVLNTNWKIYCSEQSFTGLGPEDQWLSWGLPYGHGCCHHTLTIDHIKIKLVWIVKFAKLGRNVYV